MFWCTHVAWHKSGFSKVHSNFIFLNVIEWQSNGDFKGFNQQNHLALISRNIISQYSMIAGKKSANYVTAVPKKKYNVLVFTIYKRDWHF